MKSFLIIGLGRFGAHLCRNLSKLDNEIMIVDKEEEKLQDLLPFVVSAKIGDCTNEKVLNSLGVGNFDICFVCIGNNFQSSLEITSLIKEAGAAYVVSKADRDIHAKFLLRNGADEVVYPEKQLAAWTAIRCTSEYILDYIELDSEYSIFELSVPEDWMGKTVLQLDLRKKFGINILGLRQNQTLDMHILPETVLSPGVSLLVLGQPKAIQKCLHI